MKKRRSGILCHISSLPSPFGIGDFGPTAYAFADFLSRSKQAYWQILPLNPTTDSTNYSPYTSISAFAGNTYLISPSMLVMEGLLSESDLLDRPDFPPDKIDFRTMVQYKEHLFQMAMSNFQASGLFHCDYQNFCIDQANWLQDFALFSAVYSHFGQVPIHHWPSPIKNRDEGALAELQEKLKGKIEQEMFLQYVFFRQWTSLKHYCNKIGVRIIGDFPLFMTYDAADIWLRPELFKLDQHKKPSHLAGSPPDSFSKEGQLFICAVYNWEEHQKAGYSWWMDRLNCMFKLFDVIRIDHFRGLVAYWETPAGETTARNGRWQSVPFYDFMDTVLKYSPTLPMIAEDLGVITPDVREAMREYDVPGIKVLLFAYATEMHERKFLPHNHIRNGVVYTSTHDTNTCIGWFQQNDNLEEKERFFKYIGRSIDHDVHWEFIKLAMMSVAHTTIIPLQDLLGLGETARMNTPGVPDNNWLWRHQEDQVTLAIQEKLRNLTELYERS